MVELRTIMNSPESETIFHISTYFDKNISYNPLFWKKEHIYEYVLYHSSRRKVI
jgi:hypothetical protein